MPRSKRCEHTHMDIVVKSSGQPKAACSGCGKRLVGVAIKADGPCVLKAVAVAPGLYDGKWRR